MIEIIAQLNKMVGPSPGGRFNTLRPRQNGRHFPDNIFKYILLNENIWIWIKISLKFVPKGSINNIPALVQIMAWRWPGDRPLSEPMMDNLPTPICVTRPQWVNKKRCRLTNIGIPMWKIRRSRDCLLFNMGIPYLEKTVFLLRRSPGST